MIACQPLDSWQYFPMLQACFLPCSPPAISWLTSSSAPLGVQFKAVLSVASCHFHSVWPICFHFLFFIFSTIGVCLAKDTRNSKNIKKNVIRCRKGASYFWNLIWSAFQQWIFSELCLRCMPVGLYVRHSLKLFCINKYQSGFMVFLLIFPIQIWFLNLLHVYRQKTGKQSSFNR